MKLRWKMETNKNEGAELLGKIICAHVNIIRYFSHFNQGGEDVQQSSNLVFMALKLLF